VSVHLFCFPLSTYGTFSSTGSTFWITFLLRAMDVFPLTWPTHIPWLFLAVGLVLAVLWRITIRSTFLTAWYTTSRLPFLTTSINSTWHGDKKNSTIVDPSSGVRPTSNSSGRSPTVFECCRDAGLTLTSRSLVFDCGGEISVHGYRSPQPRTIRGDNDFRSHEVTNLLSKSVPSPQILCLLPAFYLYGTLAALIHFHNAL